MSMGIDESGQQRRVAEIDHFGVPGNRQPGSNRNDLVVFNQNDRVAYDRLALSVDEARGANGSACALSSRGLRASGRCENKKQECRQANLHECAHEISLVRGPMLNGPGNCVKPHSPFWQGAQPRLMRKATTYWSD